MDVLRCFFIHYYSEVQRIVLAAFGIGGDEQGFAIDAQVALAIERGAYVAFCAGRDRLPGLICNGAAATWPYLSDDQWRSAGVSKAEVDVHFLPFRDRPEVLCRIQPLDGGVTGRVAHNLLHGDGAVITSAATLQE